MLRSAHLRCALATQHQPRWRKLPYSTQGNPNIPLINIPRANIYRFGQSNSVTPVFRDVEWTVQDGENWAVVGSASGEKATLFQTLLGHLRISPPPPPPLGLFPLLSQDGTDPFQKITMVSFGNRSRASGAFYDYTARYGAVRDEDRITLRESVFPEMIKEVVGELGYRPTEEKSVNEEDMRYFEELAERMGLTKLLDLPLVALSNGQTRRARVVKAVLSKPELLLLDEPLTGLDVHTRPSLLTLLHELHSARKPLIILGLRTQDAIPEWITHIALVSDGHLHAGTKADIQRVAEGLNDTSGRGKQYAVKKVMGDGNGEVLVDMKNVGVKYGSRTVLQAINWQIKEGERWHLVGANGSGKTTLLSLITGDHPQSYTQSSSPISTSNPPDPTPSSTTPQLQHHLHLFSLPRSRIPTPVLHSMIGVVSPELFDAFPRRTGLSVWEAIVTGFEGVFSVPRGIVAGKGGGVSKEDSMYMNVGGKLGEEMSQSERKWRIRRVWEVIERLGPVAWVEASDSTHPSHSTPPNNEPSPISREFASRSFASLSAGEQRIVLLMRALVGRPRLVLLDEVWSGMDARMIKAARAYLRGETLGGSGEVDDGEGEGERGEEGVGEGEGVGRDQAVVVITHWEDEVPWGVEDGVKKFVLESGVGKVVS